MRHLPFFFISFFSLFVILVSCGDHRASSNPSPPTPIEHLINASFPCIDMPKWVAHQEDSIREQIHAAAKTQQLDNIFSRKVKKEGFNGNVLIAQKGVILYHKAFGFAQFKRDGNVALTDDSEFQLASLSKTFTAVAILKLYEENKLSLDDTLQKFFPTFPYHGISIRMLLSHRSGLPYYIYAFDDSVGKAKTRPNNDIIINWFESSKPKPYGLPNKGFSYNNTNFALLASIVETVSGTSFANYLKTKIFNPLGMKHTRLVSDPIRSHNHLTYGYEGRRLIQKDYFDDVEGDKGVFSTTGDLLKWSYALQSECILKQTTLQQAFQAQSFERKGIKNYGLGFRLILENKNSKQTKYIYHTGWWKGYSTLLWFSPHDDFVVIILSNRKNGSVYRIKDLLQVMERNTGSSDEELVQLE